MSLDRVERVHKSTLQCPEGSDRSREEIQVEAARRGRCKMGVESRVVHLALQSLHSKKTSLYIENGERGLHRVNRL